MSWRTRRKLTITEKRSLADTGKRYRHAEKELLKARKDVWKVVAKYDGEVTLFDLSDALGVNRNTLSAMKRNFGTQ